MYKKQIFITTSSKHFCEWLRKKTSEYDENLYPTANGYYKIGRADYKNSFFEKSTIMKMSGAYVYPKNADKQFSNGYTDLINIFVQELDDTRIEVTFQSNVDAIENYIEKIVAEIARLWPINKGNVEIIEKLDEGILETANEHRKIEEKLESLRSDLKNGLLYQKEFQTYLKDFENAILWGVNEENKIIKNNDKEILLTHHNNIKSEMTVRGKLELLLPIIPVLLNYKVEIEHSNGINLIKIIDQIINLAKSNNMSKINNESTDNQTFSDNKQKRDSHQSIQSQSQLNMFTKFRSLSTEKKISIIISIIALILTIAICIFTPIWENIVGNWFSSETPVVVSSEVEVKNLNNVNTITPTKRIFEDEGSISLTVTPSIYIPTLSPTETPTLQSTEQSENSSILIGVIKLKDECWGKENLKRKDDEIIERLSSLGFSVSKIGINSNYSGLSTYDVVYIPQGWYCQFDEIQSRVNQLQEFTKYGGGLLIGNPDITRQEYTFEIFQTKFTYKPKLNVSNDFPPIIIDHDPPRSIINNFSNFDFPLPENSIKPNIYNNIYAISKGSSSNEFSFLILDPYTSGRAVFITGGEFSESPHPLDEQMWVRIIYWLTQRIQ